MKRLRALAAFMGCLAVLASGFMSVAAAAETRGGAATERSAAGAPCSHCDECDGVPCPAPMVACVQVPSNVAPAPTVSGFDLPAFGSTKIRWWLRAAMLIGLSPLPDPFPPRT